MLTLSTNKYCTRLHKVTRSCRVRNSVVVKATRKSQDIKELLQKEIAKANDVCCDMSKSDVDCMLQWDVINDLSQAYRSAVENEKREQELREQQADGDYIWETSKKTFQS